MVTHWWLVDHIVMEDGIPLLPEGIEVLKLCRSAFCCALEGKFQCTAQIHNVEDGAASSFSHSKATIVPEIKYSKQISRNLKVSVWKDDLTTHKVDAVVNAANEYLSHGAGLALALSRAGGRVIQEESDEIIKQKGKVHTETVIEFGKKRNPGAMNLEVRLVNNDDPSVREMEKACCQFLGSSDPLPKQNQVNAPTQPPFPSLDLGSVTLCLKKGGIESETTDVIVNTIGTDKDLSKGLVSRALLERASGRLQQEIKQDTRGPVSEEGRGGIIINGESVGVSCAALEVEAMLCQVQEEFAQSELKDMLGNLDHSGEGKQLEWLSNKLYKKTPLNEWDGKDTMRYFEKSDLRVVKVEKIENPILKELFDFNCKRIQAQPKRLYQCVNAEFCDLTCRVGFQREYTPPKEQRYGAGIYFTSDLRKARYLWPENEDEYLYFIQAQVLTGKDMVGSPELIVPPPIGRDPLVRYDSVTNGTGIHIIFNGQQAYPEFLITCRKQGKVSHI
ncbi:hypothetical protein QTP70_013693 [Hemibagrus guttatus]|uniref:Poly [ADP-ribose] polymerase n=1 Tax=Hemibagrus guttatus TaxID=175788 RepID=A0AAE0V5D5_9TELE|nr:hypothetical protein QTP70_013693 [Hemibagrus guttatus]